MRYQMILFKDYSTSMYLLLHLTIFKNYTCFFSLKNLSTQTAYRRRKINHRIIVCNRLVEFYTKKILLVANCTNFCFVQIYLFPLLPFPQVIQLLWFISQLLCSGNASELYVTRKFLSACSCFVCQSLIVT